jgi:PRTRC genetic system protein E
MANENELENAVGLLKEMVNGGFELENVGDEKQNDLLDRVDQFIKGKRSGIFTELSRVVSDRVVVLTIALESSGEIYGARDEREARFRVNVIPKKKQKKKDGEDDGEDDSDLAILVQPFTVVGTAAELDAGLPKLLSEFVAERKKAADSITAFKTAAEENRKAVEAETKKLDGEASKKNDTAKKKVAEARKKNGEKPEEKKPETGGLFEGGADEKDDTEEATD